MPVPTPDRLLQFFNELLDSHVTTSGNQPVCEWRYLLTSGFRHFKSTSPAIEARMKTLLDEGRLVRVEISSSGYVHFKKEELRSTLAYFQYATRHRYDQEMYGHITFDRPELHENVWRTGTRDLYTTPDRLDDIVMDVLDAKRKKDEVERQKEAAEAVEQESLLRGVVADGPELLKQLEAVIPSSEIRTNIFERDGKAAGFVYLTFRGKGVPELFDLLRRGLPDVPRETSTD